VPNSIATCGLALEENRDFHRFDFVMARCGAAEENVLDHEFLAYCETQADDSVSLETVRQALAKIPGSLVDDIRAERDQR
jgi:hypothetical protein